MSKLFNKEGILLLLAHPHLPRPSSQPPSQRQSSRAVQPLMQNPNSLTALSPPADESIECQPQGQKRPAAAAWDDSANDRASSKRRASRACLSCRNRKVRCDVINSGVPCTNCRLDCVDCVVTESNRGRRPTASGPAVPITISVATAHPPEPSASRSPCSSPQPCVSAAGPRAELPAEATSPLSHPSQADAYSSMASLTFEGQSTLSSESPYLILGTRIN